MEFPEGDISLLVDNFIYEFDKVFGKYLSKEELMKRLEENMGEIKFNFFNNGLEHFMGRYNASDKSIEIPNTSSQGQLTSAFFYQMMHYVTVNQMRYHSTDNQPLQTSREVSYNQNPNIGFNEAFIQYATHLRDYEFDDVYDYDCTDVYFASGKLLRNISRIYGEDEFLMDAFNNPSIFLSGQSENKSLEISDEFDVLYQAEDEFRSNPNFIMDFLYSMTQKKAPKQESVEKAKLSLLKKVMKMTDERANPTTSMEFDFLCSTLCNLLSHMDIEHALSIADLEILARKAAEINISPEETKKIICNNDLIPRDIEKGINIEEATKSALLSGVLPEDMLGIPQQDEKDKDKLTIIR